MLAAGACGQPASERSTPAREAGTSSAPSTPAQPAAVAPRIVFLGDSLTAGYGLTRGEEVPALIQSRLTAKGYRYEVVNAGVSGDTSAGGLSRLDWSLEGNVAALVVELGANDGLRGLPVPQMRKNLAAMSERSQKAGARVLLVGMKMPPNYGPDYSGAFEASFAELAKRHKAALVPFLLEGFAENPDMFQPDRIHPTAEAQPLMLERVWQALRPLL
jgi:acyl-CoA thioesterase I